MATNDYPVKRNCPMKVFPECYCPHGHVHHAVFAFFFSCKTLAWKLLTLSTWLSL